MMCDRDDLETERQHVGYKARLDDLGRINALFLEMRKAFLEEAADGAENLQVVCDSCVVERKGHGVGFPSLCVLIACDTAPEITRITIEKETDAPPLGDYVIAARQAVAFAWPGFLKQR